MWYLSVKTVKTQEARQGYFYVLLCQVFKTCTFLEGPANNRRVNLDYTDAALCHSNPVLGIQQSRFRGIIHAEGSHLGQLISGRTD